MVMRFARGTTKRSQLTLHCAAACEENCRKPTWTGRPMPQAAVRGVPCSPAWRLGLWGQAGLPHFDANGWKFTNRPLLSVREAMICGA